MKFVRALGGFLCFIGILAALVGILAVAVPMIDNEQVKRIVESFSLTSADQMLNTVNQVILYCLAHGSLLFGAGATTLLVGGLMKSGAERTLYRNEPAKQPTQPKAEAKEANRPTQTAPVRETAAPARRALVATPGYSPPSAVRTSAFSQNTSDLFSAPPTEEKYRPRSIIDLANEPESRDNAVRDAYSAYREEPTPIDSQAEPPTTANGTLPIHTEDAVYVARYQAGPASTHCAECGAENLLEQPVCSRCGRTLNVAADTQPQAASSQEHQRREPRAAEATRITENKQAAYSVPNVAGDAGTAYLKSQVPAQRNEDQPEQVRFHPPIPEKDRWMEKPTSRSAQTGEAINGAMGALAGNVKLAGSMLRQGNALSPEATESDVNDARYAQPPMAAQTRPQTLPSPDAKEPYHNNEESAKPHSHIRIVSTMGKHSV